VGWHKRLRVNLASISSVDASDVVGILRSRFSVDHSSIVQKLFEQQEILYSAGARNFLFVDLPPIHRSPAGRGIKSPSSYEGFNTQLHLHARAFGSAHVDATVMLFSAWNTFSSFLDDPEAYGFERSDSRKIGGAIWYDHLHPTSKAHDIVAKDLGEFVGSVHR
jgi:phospholipase/lecithinase/hemolysin